MVRFPPVSTVYTLAPCNANPSIVPLTDEEATTDGLSIVVMSMILNSVAD